MTQFTFVGIDVASEKFDVAIRLDPLQFKTKTFKNSRKGLNTCLTWLKQNCPFTPWVCMESTGRYSETLAEYFYEKKVRVSVANPYKMKHYAKSWLSRHKNDIQDAKIIARYAKERQPRLFVPRTLESKQLREWVLLLDQFKKANTALKTQLHGCQCTLTKRLVRQGIKANDKQIQAIQQQIQQLMCQPHAFALKQSFDLLRTIPGVGELTAYRILAYVPNIGAFANAKQLAAYIGLCPKQSASGKYQGKTKLSKFGAVALRKGFYFPALAIKRHAKAFWPFIKRLERNGLCAMAVIGALMRKLSHIIFGVLKSQTPYDPALVSPRRM